MARTTWSGPLASGTKNAGETGGPNIGLTVLSQTALINKDATLVQDATFYLPANAQIIDVIADVLTAYNSATSATFSAGITSGGTEYGGSVNVKTTGRKYPTYSAAQLAAMDDIGTDTTLVATVTSVGQPTLGQVRVTVTYVQTGS